MITLTKYLPYSAIVQQIYNDYQFRGLRPTDWFLFFYASPKENAPPTRGLKSYFGFDTLSGNAWILAKLISSSLKSPVWIRYASSLGFSVVSQKLYIRIPQLMQYGVEIQPYFYRGRGKVFLLPPDQPFPNTAL